MLTVFYLFLIQIKTASRLCKLHNLTGLRRTRCLCLVTKKLSATWASEVNRSDCARPVSLSMPCSYTLTRSILTAVSLLAKETKLAFIFLPEERMIDGTPEPIVIKSDLFRRMITLLLSSKTSFMSASCRFLRPKVISALCSKSVTSRTNRTLWALASSSFVISIPSYSMRSSVWERRPAVSVRIT